MKEKGFTDTCRVRDLTHWAVFVGILRKNPIACVYDSLLLFSGQRKESFVHTAPPLTDPVNHIINPLTDFEKTFFKIFKLKAFMQCEVFYETEPVRNCRFFGIFRICITYLDKKENLYIIYAYGRYGFQIRGDRFGLQAPHEKTIILQTGSAVSGKQRIKKELSLIGMILNTISYPAQIYRPGIKFTSKKLLKFAIILLGLSLDIKVIANVGKDTLFVMLFTLATCF